MASALPDAQPLHPGRITQRLVVAGQPRRQCRRVGHGDDRVPALQHLWSQDGAQSRPLGHAQIAVAHLNVPGDDVGVVATVEGAHRLLAAEHIEALKDGLRSLPETLTYNDFHWTNLALSRHQRPEFRAVVFDYHLLGIGLAASNCRNVGGSLGAAARAAFWVAYGAVDERAAALDAPVATLHALRVAVQRPELPRWALPLVHEVTTGELEAKLRHALALLERRCQPGQ